MATNLSAVAKEPWDAVVIGAGPAGSVSAAVLVGKGLRTLLIDRATFPRRKVCGGCLAPAGASALADLALPMPDPSPPPRRTDALRLIARGASLRLPIEPYTMVNRAHFDETLARAAENRGAVFLQGVRGRVLPGDAVKLIAPEGECLLQPRLVVVADGLGGGALTDRPEFAWNIDERSPVGIGLLLDRRPEHALEGEITMVCGRGGYVGAARVDQTHWTIACALRASMVQQFGPAGAIAAIMAESGYRTPALDRGSMRGVGQLTRRRLLASGRVLVVGDAGGYVEPLTGEGMSWAIACAARIGPAADEVLCGRDARPAWSACCAEVLSARRTICRAVCTLASQPVALAAALRLGGRFGLAGWASRRLCWSAA
ncbi:MAG: hypothetical protein IPJ41_03040 [Phycisphaerales bacterium]|nr:hypothetical protein [Phycisphaerales bacterium]